MFEIFPLMAFQFNPYYLIQPLFEEDEKSDFEIFRFFDKIGLKSGGWIVYWTSNYRAVARSENPEGQLNVEGEIVDGGGQKIHFLHFVAEQVDQK